MLCMDDFLASIASYIQMKTMHEIADQHMVGIPGTKVIANSATKRLALTAEANFVQNPPAGTSSESFS